MECMRMSMEFQRWKIEKFHIKICQMSQISNSSYLRWILFEYESCIKFSVNQTFNIPTRDIDQFYRLPSSQLDEYECGQNHTIFNTHFTFKPSISDSRKSLVAGNDTKCSDMALCVCVSMCSIWIIWIHTYYIIWNEGATVDSIWFIMWASAMYELSYTHTHTQYLWNQQREIGAFFAIVYQQTQNGIAVMPTFCIWF